MGKSVKIWLVIALILVLLGAFIFAIAMANYGWNFTKLSTDKYVNNTYNPDSEFDKISINVNTTDIKLAPSEDGKCSIVCRETDKIKHSAFVQNGTLIIEIEDTRRWYDHIGIFYESPNMTVYLPKKEYVSLIIETDTGDIILPKCFNFKSLEIDGDTSDIKCLATASNLEIETSTGDVNLDTVTADRISISSDTGDIKLKSVVADNSIEIETDTGDVAFEGSDAKNISVQTDTGDVTGTLLTSKIFFAESDTGRINVPKTTTGGKCEIITSTGDIKIDITS